MLWATRHQPGSMASYVEQLMSIAPHQMDEVELYVPQFAHIVVNLADDISPEDLRAIERFLLSISQLSIHIVRIAAHQTDLKQPPLPMRIPLLDHGIVRQLTEAWH